MNRRLAFSVEAKADLRDIARFSLERFGRDIGGGYVAGLRAACKRAGQFPGRAPFHPLADPPARVLVHRSHRIFYRVEPDRVLIVRILHHAHATPPTF